MNIAWPKWFSVEETRSREDALYSEEEILSGERRFERAVMDVKKIPLTMLTMGELIQLLNAWTVFARLPPRYQYLLAPMVVSYKTLVLKRILLQGRAKTRPEKSRPIRTATKKHWKY